jgi:phosphatidate cytidylyltransferase
MSLFALADPTVWLAQGVVFAFIAVCSTVGLLHPRIRANASASAAIHSWWPVSIVATLGNHGGPLAAAVVFGAVSAGLVVEGVRLLGLPPRESLVFRVFGAAVAVGAHVALLWRPDGALIVVGVAAFVGVPLLQLRVGGPDDFLRRAAGVQWVLTACVGLFSFGPRLCVDPAVLGPHGGPGAGYVFFVLVMMADAMAWVGGKLGGRTPLAPRVSPKKTYEGLAFASLICGALGALLFHTMLAQPAWRGAVVGVGVAVVGLCGDLIMSGWKRSAGQKDSGQVLPGQGGLIDRCDSILFVAPWFWLYVTTVGAP